MKKAQKCCILLLCLALNGYAQEQDSINRDKKVDFAVYPALAYTPETQLNVGAIAFFVFNKDTTNLGKRSFYRPSSITPFVVFTTKKQALFKSDFDLFLDNGMNFNFEVRLFDFPDNYYGIGNDNVPGVVEKFADKYVELAGNIFKPINKKLFAGLVFDFQYDKIGTEFEGLLETEVPVGINGGLLMGMGPGFRYDSRNSTLYPTKGRLATASFTSFGEGLGSEYSYSRFLLDYRQYFTFISPKTVMAFQVRMDMTSGRDIPFYKLPKIGGNNRLRGIENRNLYRDRQAIFAQIEARQELFWRLGGVLFVGAGQVFDSFDDFEVGRSHIIYGLGGRFQALKGQRLNFRLDLGFTDKGQSAFYFAVREAF